MPLAQHSKDAGGVVQIVDVEVGLDVKPVVVHGKVKGCRTRLCSPDSVKDPPRPDQHGQTVIYDLPLLLHIVRGDHVQIPQELNKRELWVPMQTRRGCPMLCTRYLIIVPILDTKNKAHII